MFSEYPADFHIHTCLSPCASDEMIPSNILNMAELLGTKILGICDHNSMKNIEAMLKAAEGYDLIVIPGMEVQSIEEVHLLCFFRNLYKALEWQDFIYKHLPNIKNNPKFFGHQHIVDVYGNVVDEEERMLLNSTTLTVEQISEKVALMGGFLIPAHVDKSSYSIIGQLGFIPEELGISVLEFSREISQREFIDKFVGKSEYSLITSSDAHHLREMVFQKTFLQIKSLDFDEVILALTGKEGRRVLIKE